MRRDGVDPTDLAQTASALSEVVADYDDDDEVAREASRGDGPGGCAARSGERLHAMPLFSVDFSIVIHVGPTPPVYPMT